MNNRIEIDGVVYQRVLNESLWKPYTKYRKKLPDGSSPLIATFDSDDWDAEIILQPMTGTPGAVEMDLTIDAEGETMSYQRQGYELDDIRDDFEDICKILNRKPDLDEVIDLPDRFDFEDVTDEDDIFIYRLPDEE